MHRLFIALAVWLSLSASVHGVSVEIPITTTNLNQNKYLFSVSTNAVGDGVTFHVIVRAKTEDIYPDSTTGLSVVTHTKTDHGSTDSIEGVKPEIQIRMKKENRVWEADFTVSTQLLQKPGLCFVFTEFAQATIDGKIVGMPAAVFYEIRLHDFLKK